MPKSFRSLFAFCLAMLFFASPVGAFEMRGPNFNGILLGISVEHAVAVGNDLGYYVYSYKPELENGDLADIKSIAMIDPANRKVISQIRKKNWEVIEDLQRKHADIYISNALSARDAQRGQSILFRGNGIRKAFELQDTQKDFVSAFTAMYLLPKAKKTRKVDTFFWGGKYDEYVSEDNGLGVKVTFHVTPKKVLRVFVDYAQKY